MSQQANIVAFDGASTPLTHTLTSVGVYKDPLEGMIAEWREMLATVPNGACPHLKFRRRQLKGGVTRIAIDLKISVMETVLNQNASGYTAPPKVANVDQHSYVGYFSERSTTAVKRLGRQWLINILNGVATTVTPVTTGNAPEFIDQDIFPT